MNDASIVRHRIYQGVEEIKREINRIKLISSIDKKYQDADTVHNQHFRNSCFLESDVNKLGISWHENNGLNDYKKLVAELYNIKHEALKQKKSSTCAYQFCKKKNLTSPYVYDNMDGYKTVFCDNNCFTKWKEQINKYTCEFCKQNKSGQYWYNKGIKGNKKFCSQECLNYWKAQQERTATRKKCLGSSCQNELTENDVLYCSICIRNNDKAFTEAMRIGEELRDMVGELGNEINNNQPISNGNPNKGKEKNNSPNNREKAKNHQEQQRLKDEINNLENKPTRTPAEEQALARKRKELEALNNPQQNQGNKNNNKLGTYVVIGLIICVIVGLGCLLVKKQSKNKHSKK